MWPEICHPNSMAVIKLLLKVVVESVLHTNRNRENILFCTTMII